jgi:hypothetical protein
LFNKIQKAPAEAILKQRFRVPNFEKFYLFGITYFRSTLGLI